MDPYLEGYLWPDVHHRLATQISDQLMPLLRPKYVARIEIHMVTDETPEAEIGIMYPDVEIVRTYQTSDQLPVLPRGTPTGEPTAASMTPITVSVPLLEFEVRLATVEIRDVAQNQLVTSIEILSPVNKREPGLSRYREKRQHLRTAKVHLLEIDLLRRGQRIQLHPHVRTSDYRVALIRAQARVADIWSINLPEPLPTVPVPLRAPDADVLLNLATALATIYDRAAYDLSIQYTQPPPPPPLSVEARTWLQERLQQYQ
jgi:hypothetical protein